MASQDRYLLERVTDTPAGAARRWKIRDPPGSLDQYLQLRRGAAVSGDKLAGTPMASDSRGTTAAVGSAGPSREETRQAKQDLTRLERQMTKTSSQIEKNNQQMSDVGSKAMVDFEKMSSFDAILPASGRAGVAGGAATGAAEVLGMKG